MIIRRVINPLSCILWREGAKEPGSQWLFAPVYAFEVNLFYFLIQYIKKMVQSHDLQNSGKQYMLF